MCVVPSSPIKVVGVFMAVCVVCLVLAIRWLIKFFFPSTWRCTSAAVSVSYFGVVFLCQKVKVSGQSSASPGMSNVDRFTPAFNRF